MFAARILSCRVPGYCLLHAHFFPRVVEMTMEDARKGQSRTATSEDVIVDKHRVLVGRRF